MKSLIVIALLFPLWLMADQGTFLGKDLGEVSDKEQECDSTYSSCYEEGQLDKTHHRGRHYHDRPRRHHNPRYYHNPRPYYPNQYYHYNPGPYYYPQYQLGYICRSGHYYCGMNYPAPIYTSCYCNLGFTYFHGTVTNY